MNHFHCILRRLPLLLAIILVSCSKEGNTDEPTPEPTPDSGIEEHPKVTVFSDSQRDAVLAVSDDGVIVMNGVYTEADFPVNSVIVSAPAKNAPQGFLYKVKTVTSAEGKTTITTGTASLEEIIENGSAHEDIDITNNISAIYDAEGNLVEQAGTRAIGGGLETGMKYSFELGPEIAQIADFSIKGDLELKSTLHIDIDYRDWTLQYFTLWIEPELKFELSAGISVKGPIEKPVKILSFDTTPITILVAGIPIVFTPHVIIYAKFGLEGEAKIFAHWCSLDFKVKAGVEYKDGETPHLIFENTSEDPRFLENGVDFALAGGLRIGPKTELIPDLYNLGKLTKDDPPFSITSETFLRFTFSGDHLNINDIVHGNSNPFVKLSFGNDIGVKINFTVLKVNILRFEKNDTLFEIPLKEGHFSPTYSGITVDEDRGDVLLMSYIIKDVDDPFFKVLYEHGFSFSEGIYENKFFDPHEYCWDLGKVDLSNIHETNLSAPQPSHVVSISRMESSPPTRGTGIDYKVTAEVPMDNLQLGMEYTFRPYSKNLFYRTYGDGLVYVPGAVFFTDIDTNFYYDPFGLHSNHLEGGFTIHNITRQNITMSLSHEKTEAFSVSNTGYEFTLAPGASRYISVSFIGTSAEPGTITSDTVVINTSVGKRYIRLDGHIASDEPVWEEPK